MPSYEMSTSMRLSQQQKLSPQMLQSINILALPIDELRDKIYEEVEKNPALEIAKDTYYVPASTSSDFQSFFESIPNTTETLKEHLLVQLAEHNLDETKKQICKCIIQSLDDKGFFAISKDELKESLIVQGILLGDVGSGNAARNGGVATKDGVAKDDATKNGAIKGGVATKDGATEIFEECVKIVQSFDPGGICVSDIFESLSLQASAFENVPPLVFDLLKNPSLLAIPRANLIQSKLQSLSADYKNISAEDVTKAMDFIRSLDPYPARQFDSENKTIFVSPDVIVTEATAEEIEEGNEPFIVELAQNSVPSVRLSSDFVKLKNASKDAAKFVTTTTKDASWFINALEQRKATMYKVAKIIVKKQNEFFEKGKGNLRPLTMKSVAEEAEIHEATVSRIANGKYLRCKWGLFELRYFFTNSITAQNAIGNKEDISKESVKHKIIEILQEAEKQNPNKKLSDEKLTQKLKECGINIARRTVAKYRSELSIKSSFDR